MKIRWILGLCSGDCIWIVALRTSGESQCLGWADRLHVQGEKVSQEEMSKKQTAF
jgi:hypothetical protein